MYTMLINYLFNSTALLGGGIYPSSNWDISAAACNAFFPGLRILGAFPFPFPFAFDASTSFLVWLFSTSFRDRLTPCLGRCGSPVSPLLSLLLLELSLEEEEDSLEKDILDREGIPGEGDGD